MIISRWGRKYFQFYSEKISTPSSVSIKLLTPCWHKYFQFYSDNVDTVFTSWKSALFPKICRANHSCVPNCNYVWNPELGQQQMFLVKKVNKGQILVCWPNGQMLPTPCHLNICYYRVYQKKHNYGPKIITKFGC